MDKKKAKVKEKAKGKKIKESVRKRYGIMARRVSSEACLVKCCGTGQSATSPGQVKVVVSCCEPSESAGSECCAPSESTGSCSSESESVDGECCAPSETASTTCTGSETTPGSCHADPASYSEKELADLPDSVTCASLGCGNPVTINELKLGEVVLDLGSGGGIDCFLAAKKVGEKGKVIGLDMTGEMIELAKSNAEKVGAKNVEFHYGEMEDIPLADRSVDVIMSNCVINLSPDKDAVFREAFRVLKPGGRISVSDIVIHGQIPDPLRENMDSWSGCVAGALEESDYLDRMKAVGFEDIEVLSRKKMRVGSSSEWKGLREQLEKSGISPDDLDFEVVSIRVRASKPA